MFSLISGTKNSAKAIFPDQVDNRFDTYFEFETVANTLADRTSLYSKLDFTKLFLNYCRNSIWYRENYNTAVQCFFLLISDPGVLFAQTREWRAASNAITQNAAQHEDEDTVESAEINFTEIAGKGIEYVIRLSVQCGPLLPEQMRNALQVVIHEWSPAKEDCPAKKGRPAKILFYPPKLYEQLAYRDHKESEEEWMQHRESKLYENSKVLGVTAKRFYQLHKDELKISEDQWRDVVLNWLGMLASYISLNSYQPVREYRPFFLLDQVPQLNQLKEKAEIFKNCLKPKNDKCPLPFLTQKPEREAEEPFPYRPWEFAEEYPLENDFSPENKLRGFESALIRTRVKVGPDAAGILFLMRSHMHTLLNGRGMNDYPKNSSKVFVTTGIKFFDAVQASIEESIQFQERNLRSLDSIYITDKELRNARLRDPSIVKRLEEELSLNHKNLVEAFFAEHQSLFLTPRHPAEAIRNALRIIVDQLDWKQLLPEKYVVKRPNSSTKESWKKNRHSFIQYGLVEYVMLQKLAEQGRNDLTEIAKCLFRL